VQTPPVVRTERSAVLDRARAGDTLAFQELTEPYRRELHLHCYRLLGSFTDAEDVLQETMVAAWRGLDGFAGRASLRTWLYRIATNRCLNALRDARRRPPEPVPPFTPPEPTRRGEVTWLQPYPDAVLAQVADSAPGPESRYRMREAVELAFIVGLQQLPPRQAAVLVLRDVLGYTTAEVADLLDTSATAVKGALQRARQQLNKVDPDHVPLPEPQERALTRRFADAFTTGDIEGVVALLTDDAWLAMPPAPHEYHGAAAITAFLTASFGRDNDTGTGTGTGNDNDRGFRMEPTRANTQPAFACHFTGPDEPAGLIVLTLRDDRIRAITRFLPGQEP
jgi:RNA polymerase sigma-70 factor (ECF subfamily)